MCNIKNIHISWNYWNFPRQPVSAEKFEIMVINTILMYYHYRVDPKLGKGVCANNCIPCASPACVAQLDIDRLPNIAPSYKLS